MKQTAPGLRRALPSTLPITPRQSRPLAPNFACAAMISGEQNGASFHPQARGGAYVAIFHLALPGLLRQFRETLQDLHELF